MITVKPVKEEKDDYVLFAYEGDTYLGSLSGLFITDRLYYIKTLSLKDEAFNPAGSAFSAFLAQSFSKDGIEILSWESPEKAAFNSLLESQGFRAHKKKIFVEKDIKGYTSPYEDPFIYKSLLDTGREYFVKTMTEAAEGDPFEGVKESPDQDFQDLIDYAGESFNPALWLIAFLGEEPLGVVLPQVFADDKTTGSLFYVGIRPPFRGKGYGKVLHARGLQQLAASVGNYKGSTDSANTAMARIFRANGCVQTGVQVYYRVREK